MRAAEILASRVLFVGGVVAVLLMVFGVTGFLWSHGVPALPSSRWAPPANPHVVYTSVAEVARALIQWPTEPLAIVAAGILLMLATPMIAVVAVFSVFAGVGDRRYATIAALLMGALLITLLVVSGR